MIGNKKDSHGVYQAIAKIEIIWYANFFNSDGKEGSSAVYMGGDVRPPSACQTFQYKSVIY